jgi:hypothetical protein
MDDLQKQDKFAPGSASATIPFMVASPYAPGCQRIAIRERFLEKG